MLIVELASAFRLYMLTFIRNKRQNSNINAITYLEIIFKDM